MSPPPPPPLSHHAYFRRISVDYFTLDLLHGPPFSRTLGWEGEGGQQVWGVASGEWAFHAPPGPVRRRPPVHIPNWRGRRPGAAATSKPHGSLRAHFILAHLLFGAPSNGAYLVVLQGSNVSQPMLLSRISDVSSHFPSLNSTGTGTKEQELWEPPVVWPRVWDNAGLSCAWQSNLGDHCGFRPPPPQSHRECDH